MLLEYTREDFMVIYLSRLDSFILLCSSASQELITFKLSSFYT